MKRIGFLSFGHWSDSYGSQVRTAADSLVQSLELAVAAEELGADGAYFRVHHFARQLGSPFPLLAAIGARTRTIEIGTAVIDMRYENPMYMAEDAGAADLISGGRLQLGISRGSPEQVIDGWRHFGYLPADGESDADLARRHADEFLEVIKGEGFAKPNPRPMFPNPPGLLRLEPHSEGLRDRIWWGAGSNATAQWAAARGMNLQSSTLKFDETGEPLHVQQRKQIEAYRDAWKAAGHTREPRVSVSRSVFALVDDRDRAVLWPRDARSGSDWLHRRQHARDLRPHVRCRARRARQRTRGRRSDRGCRHTTSHRAEHARRRLQRARDREHPEVRRAGTRVALTRNLGESVDSRPLTLLLGSASCGKRPVRRATPSFSLGRDSQASSGHRAALAATRHESSLRSHSLTSEIRHPGGVHIRAARNSSPNVVRILATGAVVNLEIDATVTFRTQFPRAVPVDERTVGVAFEAVPPLQLLAATQGGGTVDEGYVTLRAAQGWRRCVGIHGDDYRSPRRRECHRHLRFFPQSCRHLAATVTSARVSAAPRWCPACAPHIAKRGRQWLRDDLHAMTTARPTAREQVGFGCCRPPG